jgi:3-deoxy-manno-octulosonate cytidylyltransferase (CMP-KDO synthetase)
MTEKIAWRRMHMINPLIVIPARKASTRLPNKILADICGKPMIYHVIDRARETSIKDIIVACDNLEYKQIIENYGAIAIMTDPGLSSGSDRAFFGAESFDPEKKFDTIVCLQGDVPFINPSSVDKAVELMRHNNFHITTIAAPMPNDVDPSSDSVVKIAMNETTGKAYYFSRSLIPYGDLPKWYHIGVYVYNRKALAQYVRLPQSSLEITERLEQLRAIEACMEIGVSIVNDIPISVDVHADLEKAIAFYQNTL